MVAPILVPILSTAGSYLASKGMDLLSSVFKSSVNKGIDVVTKKIEETTGIKVDDIADEKVTEEDLLKLKQFEQEHQEFLLGHLERMKSLEIQEEAVHQKDRQSARSMQEAALAQDDVFSKRFVYIYALLITILTFAYIFAITFVPASTLEPQQWRIADTVLGFLLGVSLSAVIQFFFGSSKGSAEKANQLSDITKKLVDKADDNGGVR
ncbi:hypothetical protein [Vibrio sp. HN007]|uniref:hypothetical protein n=1 Tax=Vibrio iocasae TaxID=3098914 RepID=UPI0035D49A17